MSQSNNKTNLELRKELKALMSQAHQNEMKLQKMQEQELKFISANSLPELVDIILQGYREAYELEYVSLLLIDQDHEIRHITEMMSPGLLKVPMLIFCNSHTELENVIIEQKKVQGIQRSVEQQKALFPNIKNEPYLGSCSETCKNILFPSIAKMPGSVAILPLIRHNHLIGSLNLASYDESRFISGTATNLIKRLSSIVSVCLENAVNNEKLKLLGLTDALTGIHNRRYFMQRLEEEVIRGLRQEQPVSCLFIDIDHFKSFNDLYGHSVGDDVLREVSHVIKEQMRQSDVLARYGGEEFSVLLTNTDNAMAQEIAERIRESVSAHFIHVDELNDQLSVTVSIGCTTMLKAQNENSRVLGEMLLQAADIALYKSKESGRNCVNNTDFNSTAMARAVN